jgi:ABC-type sugar transport system permease subunit
VYPPRKDKHCIKHRTLTRKQRRTLWFYIFISPWLLGFILLGVVPLALGLLVSFTNYDGLNIATVKFVGFENYLRAFKDKDVLFSVGRTLLWGAINLPIWLGLSFLLALILNQNVKGRGFFRTAFYLPTLVPAVAAVTIWKILLDRNNGLLNGIISIYRPGTAIGWLSEYALQGMTVIAVWTGLGAGMLIFLAGLQGIPDELIEAANRWRRCVSIFRHITLPSRRQ